MKKIIGIVVGAVIVLFLVLGIARTQKKEEVLSIAKIQQKEGVPVLAMSVQKVTVRSIRSYYGTTQAKRQALVASKLMERIESIEVDVGDFVKKGDVLVRFEKKASQASVAQAELSCKNAEKDYERMKSLFAEGAISDQVLEQVKLGYEVAKENYLTSLSAVELVAPISGTVARIDFENGQVAFPGDVIVNIIDEGKYEISFDVTQDDRKNLKDGQDIEVNFGSDLKTNGKITHVSLAPSSMTRLFTAYADLKKVDGIYPGILATIEVVIDQRENVVSVPDDAIMDRGDGPFVCIIKDGKAEFRIVNIGLIGEKHVEIVDGLNEGEVVAVYGHKNLDDGTLIKIVENSDSI